MTPAEIIQEHNCGLDLRQTDIDAFSVEGVHARALTDDADGTWSHVLRDRVIFTGGDRFEFARHVPDPSGARSAFTLVCRDENGNPADVAAWRPPEIALWLGQAALLGQEQVLQPRLDFALRVHAGVIDWLRAGRDGVVVLDFRAAATLLRHETLGVSDPEHARVLRARLTLPAPPVVLLDLERAAA